MDLVAAPPVSQFAKLVGMLHETLDELAGCAAFELADEELVPTLRELERAVRRFPTVRAPLVAEIVERGIATDRQIRSTAMLLRDELRISPALAKAYEGEVTDLVGTRVRSSGEQLPPLRPHLAAAVAEGAVSHEHARLISRTLRDLPAAMPAERVLAGERDLVRHARELRPEQLAKVCDRLRDCLDPDGRYDEDAEEAERKRGFSWGRRSRDGLTSGSGLFTDEARAWLEAAMEPLAAPRHTELERDPRSAAQRNHDALAELARSALARGDLPAQAGLPATLLLTATATDLQRGTGWASTGTGGQVRISTVLAGLADTAVVGVVFDTDGQPLWCGRTTRLATTAQRHVTAVMDRGCVIPGCDVPLLRCQMHHMDDWAAGGPTDVDNLTWLCRFHHSRISGWTLERREGRVWCTPPRFLHPDQVPRLNTAFHPEDLFAVSDP